MEHAARRRVGIDVGGTFTDLLLVDDATGEVTVGKELTTPAQPAEGVERVLATALQARALAPAALDRLIHGTTLVTNTIIERKGARTALLTTRGFRDAVEIGREHRYDLYDLFLEMPRPLVPRYLRFEVPERILADGSIREPLDEAYVERLVRELACKGVEALAVAFLHSYRNPAHEQAVAQLVARVAPHLRVALSSEVAPELREYERTSTTCANVYVQALVERYLRDLAQRLAQQGFAGQFFVMLSSGGLATIDTAIRFPIRLLESGPAAGALAAAYYGREAGLRDLLSFDMGGTTAKLCVITGGEPHLASEFEVDRVYRFKRGSGLPIRAPVIEMVEIGAGGGSIARVDSLGLLKVGPESAGADPGPACYGRGGTAPTVTDADLLLGRIDPTGFSGGRMALDRDAAEEALRREVAEKLDLALPLAAFGVSEIVDENMANAARVHAIESGKDARGRTLVAFGGAAPLHAARMAEKLGLDRVLVPSHAGVGSAVGFLRAPIAYELVRSHLQRLDRFDPEAVNALLAGMRAEAEAIVRRGAPAAPLSETRSAFMRYRGQGHEIAVPLAVKEYRREDAAELLAAFEEAYRRLYSRIIPGVEVEVLSWVVLVSAPMPEAEAAPPAPPAEFAAPPARRRAVFDPDSGEFVEVAIHERAGLSPGAVIPGPAVIVEDETSTVVSRHFDARIDAFGYIELTRR